MSRQNNIQKQILFTCLVNLLARNCCPTKNFLGAYLFFEKKTINVELVYLLNCYEIT